MGYNEYNKTTTRESMAARVNQKSLSYLLSEMPFMMINKSEKCKIHDGAKYSQQ